MTQTQNAQNTQKFVPVDIEEFFDEEELTSKEDEFSTNIIVLTRDERTLVNMFFDRLKTFSPETLDIFAARMSDLERLATNIARFPSLLQKQRDADDEVRSQETLLESMLTYRNGDRMLHLPSKAILGKGFLVAKFHVFSSMARIARKSNFTDKEVTSLRNATLALMFTIMAEDVYLSLMEDTSIHLDILRQIAMSLILLWEHRSDQNIADIAPVLEAIWTARDKLAPAFGTMVGTSELLRLTIDLDENWRDFMLSRLQDSDVSQGLEEFLFGLSHEQINVLKDKIRTGSLNAIGREEVYAELGADLFIELEFDPRNFYLLYTIRRDNARARQRLNLDGPKKTLEDHYMSFILEKNKEKQYNDVYAK